MTTSARSPGAAARDDLPYPESWYLPDGSYPSSWYLPDGVTMPDSIPNQRRAHVIHSVFEARARREGRSATIVMEVALRWDPQQPGVGVDPDVMWVEPEVPDGATSVLTWKDGHSPPRIAVEIVSKDNAQKDYTEGPEKYRTSKTKELWVFDPERFGPKKEGGPWRLQVWRRDARGRFICREKGDGPFFSRELGAWIIAGEDLLRVSDDKAGTKFWPTVDEERERAETQAREAETKAREAETRARDAETKARDAEALVRAEREARTALEAKLAALEAKLAKAKPRPRKR